jgi:hypothetical protein
LATSFGFSRNSRARHGERVADWLTIPGT